MNYIVRGPSAEVVMKVMQAWMLMTVSGWLKGNLIPIV
jgi:hypothetical protein